MWKCVGVSLMVSCRRLMIYVVSGSIMVYFWFLMHMWYFCGVWWNSGVCVVSTGSFVYLWEYLVEVWCICVVLVEGCYISGFKCNGICVVSNVRLVYL